MYVWGAGYYGEIIVKYLKSHNLCIKYIIDNDVTKIGTVIDDVSIVACKNVNLNNASVFVSVTDERSNREIIEQIHNRYYNCKILSWKELYKPEEFR